MAQQRSWMLAAGSLLLMACTGDIAVPRASDVNGGASNDSTEGSSQSGASGNGSGGASGGDDEPASVGTQIFALCNGAEEQPGPRLLRLLTRREYRNTIADLLFVPRPEAAELPLEARVRGFDNNARSQAVTSRHIDAAVTLAESLAEEAVNTQKGRLLPCNEADPGCARTFVQHFGRRAFRRPVTDAELERYTALFAETLTEGSFDQGMRLVITSMLISPHFMYRSEVGAAQDDGTHRLTPYETASALSYLYWGTMPDDALFAKAEANQLSTPEQLRAEAARMLDDPRARDQLGEFSRQWLRSESVLNTNKDATLFPGFTDSLRQAMMREQELLFSKVVLEDEGSFAELFTPSYAMVNPELATFYGLSHPGGDFVPVDPQGTGRGGILGLGAVQAAHAHAMESSPIKRGLFVRDRLLCQDLPPPPANLDTTPPGLDPTLTTRERFQRHTADPACQGCHQYIDGIGFGLEEFDAIGRQRTEEYGKPVDTSGTLLGLEGLSSSDTAPFAGARELAVLIRDSESAPACLALQYYRFASGYEERKKDACSLEHLRAHFQAQDLSVKELLTELVTLHSFTVRAGE